MMFDDLQGKTALITGASGGLGLHFGHLLARHGVAVTLSARRRTALDEACAAIAASGGKARAIQMDVTDSASVAAALVETGASFDILINNAGTSSTFRAIDIDEAEWSRVLDTNLKGVFVVAQAVARAMCAQGRVARSSTSALFLAIASPAKSALMPPQRQALYT
jgi:NADP-dependent 3-hydroxy acid dehydrogenase YdfG